MSEYRFKRSYNVTSRTARLLKAAFFIVLIGFFIEIDMLFLPSDFSFSYDANAWSMTIFALMFGTGMIILPADIFLWMGMLVFIVQYDDRAGKTLWFLAVLFGMSLGAALYYFFVYRKYVQHNSVPAQIPPAMA